MAIEQQLLALLGRILDSPADRPALVREYQQLVWNTPSDENEHSSWRVFGDLAIDLDYYEPNPRRRREDASFYGEGELESIVRRGLLELQHEGLEVSREGLEKLSRDDVH